MSETEAVSTPTGSRLPDLIELAKEESSEKRRALFRRFELSQRKAQIDPWAERVAGHDAHEFNPMANFTLAEAAE